MKQQVLYSALLALSITFGAAAAESISGPDGNLTLTIDTNSEGTPIYSLCFKGNNVIEQAPLGLTTNWVDLAKGLRPVAAEKDVFRARYSNPKLKKSSVDKVYNSLVVTYESPDSNRLAIEWRVGDNDAAYRYILPKEVANGEGHASARILSEVSGFRFPQGSTCFLTPQSDAMVGWKRTKPSYEEFYITDEPVGTPSKFGHGFTFPALFHTPSAWVLLSETDVDGYYCGSHLSDADSEGVYSIAFPMPEENNGIGSAEPAIALPGKTPWRTITVGETPAPVVETTVMWDLVEPRYAASRNAIPGKGTWSWLVWQDSSINYDDIKTFIDFAAEMGYTHTLIDNFWDKNIGRERMAELIEYGRSKNVDLALWYSSSGDWNDIEQTPVNHMDRPIIRKKEMKWLRDNGVKTIKVDFFGGDKQQTIRLYEDILSDAADYGIDVIFHGCTLPRGWEQMYPNYVGSEAVLASENLVFSQEYCDKEASQATLHPYIRNASGLMEYGGTVLNRRLHKSNAKGTTRRTGDAFQIATAVVYHNPVQNFALAPNNLTDAPAVAIDFMRNVPTTWDDTRYLAGYPGRDVALARRNGNKWYVAALNAADTTSVMNLDLSALGIKPGSVATVIADEVGKPLEANEETVDEKGCLKAVVLPNGGYTAVIEIAR